MSRWWLVTVWCCGGLMLTGAGLSAWAAPGWTPGRVQAITASVWVAGFVVQTTRLYRLKRQQRQAGIAGLPPVRIVRIISREEDS